MSTQRDAVLVLLCTEMEATNTFSIDGCYPLSAVLEAKEVLWESSNGPAEKVHTLHRKAST